MGTNLPRPTDMGAMYAALAAQSKHQALSPAAGYQTIRDAAMAILNAGNLEQVSLGKYTFTSGPHTGAVVYGLVQFDGLGYPVVVVGQQPTGDYGIGIYNPSGILVTLLDSRGLAIYNQGGTLITRIDGAGVASFDTAGQPRSISGLLPSGDFGLGVYSRANDGTYQELLPSVSSADSSILTTSSTSFVAGGPSVNATVGASGTVLVTAASYCSMSATSAGETAVVGVSVDGTAAVEVLAVGTGSLAYIAAQAGSTITVPGLTPGSHSFALQYRVTDVNAGTFKNRTLIVQPL
jgi:hypothetical protein